MKLLSIIIPAHNEENVIGKCLSALRRQKTRDVEIIVVNDGSIDRTEEIVRKFGIVDRIISFRDGHSAAFARNKGVEVARGKYLMFIDADQIVEKNFLKKVRDFLEKNPNIDGSDYLVYSHKPKTILQKAWSAYRKTYPSIGLIHIIKRKVFRKLNGFNEKIFYYEDTEFMERFHKSGYKFKGPINAIVYHIEPANWKDFLRQRKWQARGILSVLRVKKELPILRYFSPTLLLPLCYLSPIPLIVYFLYFWLKFWVKTKKWVNSFLWVGLDYLGRFISLFYFTKELIKL
jgi:glycosyltransferase involved in cell wall biosynthesis